MKTYFFSFMFLLATSAFAATTDMGLRPASSWVSTNLLNKTAGVDALRTLERDLPELQVTDLITAQGNITTGPEPWTIISGTYAAMSADTTVTPVRGTQSLKFTAITNTATFELTFPFTNKIARTGFSFQIMSDDSTKIERLQLQFYPDTSGSAYHYFYPYYNGQKTNNMSTTNTWYTVHMPLMGPKTSGTLTLWTNATPTAAIRRIRVVLQPRTDQEAHVWLGSMQSVSASKAIVLLRFDDGVISQYTNALNILGTYRLPAFFSLNSTNIDRVAAFMTWEQVRALRAAGHEIGNHTMMGLTLATATTAQREYEVVVNNSIIASQIDQHSLTFVYPGNNGQAAGMADWMSSLGLHKIAYSIAWRTLLGNSSAGYNSCYIVFPISGCGLPIPVDWQSINAQAIGSYTGSDESGDEIMQHIQNCIDHRAYGSYYAHGVRSDPTSNDTFSSTYARICAFLRDEVDAGRVWVTTPTEYYKWAVDANSRVSPSINWLQ